MGRGKEQGFYSWLSSTKLCDPVQVLALSELLLI